MVKSSLAALVALLLAVPTATRADDVLKSLRPGHPRLMVLDDDVARLKQLIQSDPTAKSYFTRIQAVADDLLKAPVSERIIVGPRLLTISRQVLNRTSTLGGMYRLTGDKRYADRCRDEMLAAARFKDWNPSHFLDVAEMTNALAVGYDWIYDTLTPAERTEIKNAIVNLGLKEGIKVYASKTGWHQRTNNWNQVCNGGLTVGALAVADEDPATARKVIEAGRDTIPKALTTFAPDGGCVEGPGYWGYAMMYTTFYFSALQTALNTDFGLLASPGLSETGLFRIQSIGSSFKTFNFADAHDGVGASAEMFWLARAFHRPAYAVHERKLVARLGPGVVSPFHLFWYNADGTDADLAKLPDAAKFERIDVAYLRTSWDDATASFVGIKGGDNAASHSNLDLGDFVFDYHGQRFAYDLGPDDYNLPGYFGGQRWNYYRLRTEGQNTLTINGENQDPKATAKLIAFSPEHQFAVVDLTNAYAKQGVTRAQRGVRFFENAGILLRDELESDKPVDVLWHLHTHAKITIAENGLSAGLTIGKEFLRATVLSPQGARFVIAPADPPPPVMSTVPSGAEKRKPTEKLVLRLPKQLTNTTIQVMIAPESTNNFLVPPIIPLAHWAD